MRSNGVFAQPLRQIECDSLGQLARVNKNQCRAMLVYKGGDAVVDLVPHLVRSDRPERNSRNFDPEIELALVAYVDDHRIRASASGKKMCDLLDRLLRGG